MNKVTSESGSILVKTLLSEVKSSAVCARRSIDFPQRSSCFTKSEPEPENKGPELIFDLSPHFSIADMRTFFYRF